MTLIKPPKLNLGDKIATVSLSWGCAGDPDIRWRYDLGVSRLKNEFGLEAVAMPHSLKGEEYIRNHPEARAEDFMAAFADSSIKGIITNIGGNDSIRLLPYIDFDVIKKNPKVFIGYSDIMNCHLMCMKAGLSTFYGANLLTTFGEPGNIPSYTVKHFKNVFFHVSSIGVIDSPESYYCDPHDYKHPVTEKTYHQCDKYERLQGHGTVRGRLLGGIGGDTMLSDQISQTPLFAPFEENDNIILFIDDIVEYMTPQVYIDLFRWLDEKGIMRRLKGLIFGRLNEYPENPDYKIALLRVMKELNLTDLPILYNMPFGHTAPACVLPFGVMAEIDCENVSFSILESGVV